MALVRFLSNGKKGNYGQVELNQVAFRRDGRVEAQCALDKEMFSANVPAENGMILAVHKFDNMIRLPEGNDGDLLYALNYTTEHMYDERANALRDFCLVPGTFLPRLGYLAKGDRFTTNTVCADETVVGTEEAVEEGTNTALITALKENIEKGKVYGVPCENGTIELKVANSKPTAGIVLQAAKYCTMPDGSDGIKFVVIAD